ncbi:hypothetical protein [Streptomyces sp. NPDC058335]|uniref:hypothetical protein n=1 Tax=Streptomyces sp. NPDC058335 TaxID=3346451 RepID=UPI0036646969
MPEYTISTQSGADWPVIPVGKLSSYLAPKSFQYEVVDDSSVLVLRVGGATVSVSWELLGAWYVAIEGSDSLERADSVASEIARQLEDATGEQAIWYRVTD